MPLQLDLTDSRPLAHYAHLPFEEISRDTFIGLEQRLRPGLPPLAAGGRAEETAAAGYLEWARATVEAELVARAQEFTPLQWLHYLRAVPGSWWGGRLRTTPVYDAALAETISAQSSRQTPALIEAAGRVSFPVDPAIARKVAEFCAHTRYLSQLHTNLRWAGKGAAISFADTAFGFSHPTTKLARAVKLYDRRGAADQGMMFSRTGLGSDEDADPNCVLRIPAVPRIIPEVRAGTGYWLRFGFDTPCLDDLASFNRAAHAAGIAWWDDAPALLIAFLHQTISLVRESHVQLMRCGCLFTNRELIRSALPDAIAQAKAAADGVFPGSPVPDTLEELITAVAGLRGETWPIVQGPAVRTEGDFICMDLYTATLQLNQTASLKPAGGDLARLRGAAFENSVQVLIDGSPWAPSPTLRPLLVGKKPQRGGEDLTDLDAVGVKGDVLLLVSCKSRAYSGKYDTGDRSVVRTVEQEVLRALQAWTEKTTYMKNNPLCLHGFDFSAYRILPVVCFPFAPFVAIGPATGEVAKGVRAVSSFAELRSWLFG